MKRFLRKGARIALALAVVLAIVLALSGALGKSSPVTNRIVQTVLAPFRSGAAALTRQAQQIYSYLFQYEALQAENEELKAKGYITIPGKIPTAYFEEKVYGVHAE